MKCTTGSLPSVLQSPRYLLHCRYFDVLSPRPVTTALQGSPSEMLLLVVVLEVAEMASCSGIVSLSLTSPPFAGPELSMPLLWVANKY